VEADGLPAYFLADTAWFVIWKGTPEQWASYLDRRAAQGFSVIQVQVLPFQWELPDVEGNFPFADMANPVRPNEAYFRRVDDFVAMAAERGLRVFLAIMWGAVRPTHIATRFTKEQAVEYTRYAVARFGAYPVLWSLGGDDDYTQALDKFEAMGNALEAADPYHHPTTNHLPPRLNWQFVHHDSLWHDFHMLQTGHRRSALADIGALPLAYWKTGKAVVNGEPWYEAHPARDTREYGPIFTPEEARYAFWVSTLSGATMGHTYGSQGIWNWKRESDPDAELGGPGVGPVWSEALYHQGSDQCGLGARAMRSLPWWLLEPAPERIELDPPPSGNRRPVCAVVPGSLFVAYLPDGVGTLILKGIEPGEWRARWLDPRSGEGRDAGAVEVASDWKWRAPSPPSGEDWALIVARAETPDGGDA
jgi:hypothetical protein